jgi:hypothetical protein
MPERQNFQLILKRLNFAIFIQTTLAAAAYMALRFCCSLLRLVCCCGFLKPFKFWLGHTLTCCSYLKKLLPWWKDEREISTHYTLVYYWL